MFYLDDKHIMRFSITEDGCSDSRNVLSINTQRFTQVYSLQSTKENEKHKPCTSAADSTDDGLDDWGLDDNLEEDVDDGGGVAYVLPSTSLLIIVSPTTTVPSSICGFSSEISGIPNDMSSIFGISKDIMSSMVGISSETSKLFSKVGGPLGPSMGISASDIAALFGVRHLMKIIKYTLFL